MNRCFALIGLALIFVVSVASQASPERTVKHNLVRLSRILDMKSPTQRTSRLIRELHRNFDYDAFEQKVLVDTASKFSPPQRKRFNTAFRQMFERKIVSLADDESLRCDDFIVTAGNRETDVVVTCLHNGKEDPITLHFSPVKNGKIRDISFSGALLSRNYRGVINKLLRKEGIESLIQKIESKSANSISGQSLL
ncbi:MAG: ABC transporter substrate-binding protein [Deltaproteobacteria bacterium]|nr:ABC transporter substrate-binding protein [Deltaproteobacteria bacterium]